MQTIVTEYDLLRQEYRTTCGDCGATVRVVTDADLVRADSPADLPQLDTTHRCNQLPPPAKELTP
jgi:hypothetical protein